MSSQPSDPYAELQVSKDASAQDIKTAYRKLVLKCHPDKVQDPALKEEMQNKFHKVQQAYDILGDEKERRKHDELAENLAKLNNLRQRAANTTKANTSSPRPSKSSTSEYYPETRSSGYRPSPESRPSYSYTTRYYTRSSDNEPEIVDAEPPKRRREGSSYVDRERESRPSKRESERDRAYQKEKDRERERDAEKDRRRREKQELKDKEDRKEERRREKARLKELEEREAREAKDRRRQRERQESKARKSETRDKAAREMYPTPPPMAEEYAPMPKEKKSSSRKHRADRDHPQPDYIEDKMSEALRYQTMAQGVQNVQSRSSAPPLAPTPPPTVSPYASPEEDAPRRRSSTRRGSSDAQRVREKRSYNSKSSREHLDNLDEEPMPPRPSRTYTMPMESTHTATRPPPVPIPGNLNRAYTDIPMNRGRGRSRMESQLDMSEEEEEPRRGRDRDGRERKSSRQPKKSSSSYRDEHVPASKYVYSIDKGQDGVSRTKPLQRSSTGYSTRGAYDESSYGSAYYADESSYRHVRPQMETRTSSYQSAKYSGYPSTSPTEYSSNYPSPRYGKSYNAADVAYSKQVRV